MLVIVQAGLQGSHGSNIRAGSIPQEGATGQAGSKALLLPQDGPQRTQGNAARVTSIQEEETNELRRSTRSTRFRGR